MSENSTVPQVRIQIRGSDGEWHTPHQVLPALLAVFRGAKQDITKAAGTYTDGDLRKFRDALDELDAVVARRIREGAQ